MYNKPRKKQIRRGPGREIINDSKKCNSSSRTENGGLHTCMAFPCYVALCIYIYILLQSYGSKGKHGKTLLMSDSQTDPSPPAS